MRKLAVSLAVSLLTLGCASDWYLPEEHFRVRDSALNRVQIIYQKTPDSPRIRCDMSDRGMVTVLVGRSVTVGDDFNIEHQDPDFADVRKVTTRMTPELFLLSLQALVDAGLLEREEPDAYLSKAEEAADAGNPLPDPPKVLVRANINSVKTERFTFNEDLIAEIEMQLYRYRRAASER